MTCDDRSVEAKYWRARRATLLSELAEVEKEIKRHEEKLTPAEAVEIVRRVRALLEQWRQGDRGLSEDGPYRRRARQLERVLEGGES